MGVPRSQLTRGSFRPARARRLTEWLAFTSNANLAVAATSSALFLSFSQVNLAGLVPFTIVRIRGRVFWSNDQAAGNENSIGAYGIAIVKEPARAIGITAIPTPIDESSDDAWLHHGFMQAQTFASLNAMQVQNEEFDSKAMRKVEDGDAIVLVVENSSTVGAVFNVQARILVMLH